MTNNTLARSITWASQNLRNAPLTDINQVTDEPALSIGDFVKQFILAPPFAWRWNRGQASFNTIIGTQDYSIAIADFGFLEKAVVSDGAGTIQELVVDLSLTPDPTQSLPRRISPLLDDGSGNITFRVFPTPDKIYSLELVYQRLSPPFTSLTDTWAPIPDYMSYLYNVGVQAMSYGYFNDVRYLTTLQVFVKEVVAASEGLTDTQKNLFLQDFIRSKVQEQSAMGRNQLGNTGRSLAG